MHRLTPFPRACRESIVNRSFALLLAPVVPAMVLCACTGLGGPRPDAVPAGAVLTLHRPIELPAGRFSVWIQDGHSGVKAVNEYRSFCKLRGSSPAGGRIGPADFAIMAVDYGRDGHRITPPVSLDLFNPFDEDDLVRFTTTLTLSRAGDPPLREVVCERRDFASRGRHVSLPEILDAFGDVGTIRTPDQL